MSEMKSRLLLGLTSMAMVAGCYGSEDALSEGEGEGEGRSRPYDCGRGP